MLLLERKFFFTVSVTRSCSSVNSFVLIVSFEGGVYPEPAAVVAFNISTNAGLRATWKETPVEKKNSPQLYQPLLYNCL